MLRSSGDDGDEDCGVKVGEEEDENEDEEAKVLRGGSVKRPSRYITDGVVHSQRK